MANKKINVRGYFDVKQYDARKSREERKIKSDSETIGFGVSYDANEIPEDLKRYAHEGKDGRFFVTFKIGKNARWYDEKGIIMKRPTNADLDGRLCEANIVYATLNGNPESREACGYWVNDIQFREVQRVKFGAMDDEVAKVITEQTTKSEEKDEQELPF